MISKDEKILHEMYRRSFKASTPSGDWDEILANSVVDENGMKTIDFMAYECDDDIMKRIVEDVLKENKVFTKRRIQQFQTSFYLGCSPKTKS